MKFCRALRRIVASCRKEFARMIEERSAAGQWGLSREEQEAVDAASMAIVDQYQHSVDATATEYAQAFRRLIGLLQVSHIHTLLALLTFLGGTSHS
jgi:hypothetical protein